MILLLLTRAQVGVVSSIAHLKVFLSLACDEDVDTSGEPPQASGIEGTDADSSEADESGK